MATKKSLQSVLSTCYPNGKGTKTGKLLSGSESNPKVSKGNGDTFLNNVMHFSPAKTSGFEVCPSRDKACTDACLHTSGNPAYKDKYDARIARTVMFKKHNKQFKELLVKEIQAFVNKCESKNVIPCVRLNGTSDIVWEKQFPELFTMFPQVTFYDYTKIVKRFDPSWKLPENYTLTFSRSATNDDDVMRVLNNGGNVAIVFGGCGVRQFHKPLPKTYNGFKVIDGDKTDMRFLDDSNVVVGLRAKGDAIGDTSGFVLDVQPNQDVVNNHMVELTISV